MSVVEEHGTAVGVAQQGIHLRACKAAVQRDGDEAGEGAGEVGLQEVPAVVGDDGDVLPARQPEAEKRAPSTARAIAELCIAKARVAVYDGQPRAVKTFRAQDDVVQTHGPYSVPLGEHPV